MAADQGITGFTTAAAFEAFAAGIPGLPAGCVTNPYGSTGSASDDAWNGGSTFYINQDPNSPYYGQPYGTLENPFPIGAPMGYVVESTANFGDGGLVKGFGTTDQRESGYVDYGFNARATYTLNDYVEIVAGVQNTSYKDNSDDSYGVQDVTLTSTGIYGDLRLTLPVLDGFSGSFAARQDFNDNFNDQSIWKVGVRQNFGHGLYARGSGGTSYSLPKIDEIGAFGAGANINPGLEPQDVKAFNLAPVSTGISSTARTTSKSVTSKPRSTISSRAALSVPSALNTQTTSPIRSSPISTTTRRRLRETAPASSLRTHSAVRLQTS